LGPPTRRASSAPGPNPLIRCPSARDSAAATRYRGGCPDGKLVDYALDPQHPRGRHKARVFGSALGIGRADAPFLRDRLVEGVIESPVRGTRVTPFGVLYEVVVLVDGLNGATAPVATIWIVEDDRPPRLVSTWVEIP
jgi:hypothetical protein